MKLKFTVFLFTALTVSTSASFAETPPPAAIDPDYISCIQYIEGINVVKDLNKAFLFCSSAAKAGNADAQRNLGVMYERGDGTPIDKEAALNWYLASSKGGNGTAAFYAYEMLLKRRLEGDETLANEQLKRAGELGSGIALVHLGQQQIDGRGGPKDEKKAAENFERAAKAGSPSGAFNAALSYNLGRGVSKDFKKAAYYYQMASDLGSPYASTNLALFYHDGLGVELDEQKMFDLFKLASKQGDSVADWHLGQMYFDGTHPKVAPKNYKTAADYWEAAATKDNTEAMRSLSKLYEKGLGVRKDKVRARDLLKKAEALGPH